MKLPWVAGKKLSGSDWHNVRSRTVFEYCKWDVQSEDQCVLASFPIILDENEWRRLSDWAERLSCEALAAEREILARRDLHERLGIPRRIRAVLRSASKTNGHAPPLRVPRVMRFDFHFARE